jgi:hypothetical protein
MGETNSPSVAHVGYNISPLCPCGLQYFSTWRNIVTHGQLKENRYIPSLERDNLVEFHYLSAFEIRSDEKRASGGYGLVRECY